MIKLIEIKVDGVDILDGSAESLTAAIDYLCRYRAWMAIRPARPYKGWIPKPVEKVIPIHITPTKRMCEGSYDRDDMLLSLYGCAFMSLPALKNRMIERGWKPTMKDGETHGTLIRSLIKKYPEYVQCSGRFIKLSEKGTEYTRNLKEVEK